MSVVLSTVNWETYLRQNHVEAGGDCQLVTAINACYHLTGKIVEQGSETYEELVDLTGCRHGAATEIRKAWEKLGIWEDQRLRFWEIGRQHTLEKVDGPEEKNSVYRYELKRDCFLEVSVRHKFFGGHSVAIVDYEPRTDCVRVTNFKHVTSTEGWIFWEDLLPHLSKNPSRSEPRYEFRTFKRKA